MNITTHHFWPLVSFGHKVENFPFYDIDLLINVNIFSYPQINVLIGNTEDDITETILFAPDFRFLK